MTDGSTVIVRRVVEARRLHKEQQQPPKQIQQEQSSEKIGASTLRTPASKAKEKTADEGRGRRGRFLGRTGTLKKRLSRGTSSGGEDERTSGGQHARESWWERFRCW